MKQAFRRGMIFRRFISIIKSQIDKVTYKSSIFGKNCSEDFGFESLLYLLFSQMLLKETLIGLYLVIIVESTFQVVVTFCRI